jgi:hypothetical protein
VPWLMGLDSIPAAQEAPLARRASELDGCATRQPLVEGEAAIFVGGE